MGKRKHESEPKGSKPPKAPKVAKAPKVKVPIVQVKEEESNDDDSSSYESESEPAAVEPSQTNRVPDLRPAPRPADHHSSHPITQVLGLIPANSAKGNNPPLSRRAPLLGRSVSKDTEPIKTPIRPELPLRLSSVVGESEPSERHPAPKRPATNVPTRPSAHTKAKSGEVILVCTSCTAMILIEYEAPCPYSFRNFIPGHLENFSWLLHTLCASCVEKFRHQDDSAGWFGIQFEHGVHQACYSVDFMMNTRWFAIAERVARNPVRLVMDKQRQSVMGYSVTALRADTTAKCKVMGLKLERAVAEINRNDAIQPFFPGGFF